MNMEDFGKLHISVENFNSTIVLKSYIFGGPESLI